MLHMTWYTSTVSSLSVVTPDLKAEETRYVLSANHTHTQKYTCMKTHTHTHTHTHTLAHIHTYTHACVCTQGTLSTQSQGKKWIFMSCRDFYELYGSLCNIWISVLNRFLGDQLQFETVSYIS